MIRPLALPQLGHQAWSSQAAIQIWSRSTIWKMGLPGTRVVPTSALRTVISPFMGARMRV